MVATGAGPNAPSVPEEPGPSGVPDAGSGTYRIVQVVSVGLVLPEQYPVVVLAEAEGAPNPRRLSFRVGMAEGAALAHAVGGTRAPRPLTVDLFADTLQRFGIEVVAVRLVGRRGSTHLAHVEVRGPGGREVLDCRPSDGIALALRRRPAAPVLADERLLAGAGDVAPPVPAATSGAHGAPDPARGG